MGHGPFGVGQASYQATEVGRVDVGRPPLSDSSLLTFSDWLRGIWGEGQSGFGEAAVDELGVTLD
ncbi:hypothetical protein, partial [Streptomyces sp. NPDC058086]|uniref:hypothetical protein n=1 Tax=Streptomyces sp. NPDC058086 TaxID=3346334 RepID=UPI0036EEC110